MKIFVMLTCRQGFFLTGDTSFGLKGSILIMYEFYEYKTKTINMCKKTLGG